MIRQNLFIYLLFIYYLKNPVNMTFRILIYLIFFCMVTRKGYYQRKLEYLMMGRI